MTSSFLRRAQADQAPQTTPGTTDTLPESLPTASPTSPAGPLRRRSRTLLVGTTAAALLVTGGTVAVAEAHKTVTLDVDGATAEVTTFAGSVAGVLAEHDLELGPRDVVAPDPAAGLSSGDEIVVRTAHEVLALVDGQETRVWSTALSAEEALAGLSARGGDVRLLASRSAAAGRTELGQRLELAGPVDVVVDGATTRAETAGALDDVLESAGVTVGELDRVHVTRGTADGGRGETVTVQRVVAQEQPTVTEIPFERVTEQTDELFRGQKDVAVAGVPGQRTVVDRVILVDGVEESRLQLSDEVTTAPVTEVVREGTKERPKPAPAPAPAPAAPKPATAPRTASSSPAPAPAPAPVASSVGGDVWAALARCESGGNPTIVSSNGLYHGLYQFSVGTWQSVGGSGLPSQASPEEQTLRAQILQARSGWGQWPACSSKLGLR